jgi:hypothetical protein
MNVTMISEFIQSIDMNSSRNGLGNDLIPEEHSFIHVVDKVVADSGSSKTKSVARQTTLRKATSCMVSEEAEIGKQNFFQRLFSFADRNSLRDRSSFASRNRQHGSAGASPSLVGQTLTLANGCRG